MEGSLYPNGVLVDRAALSRTELTKAAEILRGRVDWTSRGVYSGGAVTVNAVDNTKVDIAIFSGFVPNGEFIESTTAYTSGVLDDYTADTDNYVCAVYTEIEDRSQPHETDGEKYPTRSVMDVRIRIFSEANYNALPDTDNNFANDARDRALVLAIVNANGAGIPIIASDITSPTVYNNLMYATPFDLATITGVTITGVSSGTTMGSGTLDYTYAVGPVYTLEWTSPAGGGAGAAVNPTVDGSYTLYDAGGTEYITVEVNISQLPLVNGSETVVIDNIYYQEVSRQTAEDFLHRNMVGTGIIRPSNPHGLSYDDLFGSDVSLLQLHRDVMHCNGIWKGSSATIFFPAIVGTPGGDTLNLIAPSAGDLFYINGEKLNSISQTSMQFVPANVPASAGGSHFFEIYLTDTGELEVLTKASYPDPRNMTGTWIVDMSESYPAGNYLFQCTIAGADYTFDWDGGQGVTLTSGVDDNQVIRLWDAEAVHWVDVYVNINNGATGNADSDRIIGAGVHNDTVSVVGSPDWDQNMQIYSLAGWYDSTAPAQFRIGALPYEPIADRIMIDKKIYGNICEENINDNALQELVYHPEDELHFSGVLMRRNGDFNEFVLSNPGAPSGDIEVTGGNYYCRGRRLSFAGDDTTVAGVNTEYLIYVDWHEEMQVLDITTDFGGNLYAAMEYVLGSSKYVRGDSEHVHESDHYDPPERGVVLYWVETDGAAVVDDYIDLRRNVNGPVDPWSVASFDYDSDSVNAAFDNLYAAFAYAELANTEVPKSSRGIDIRIVGNVVVDRAIAQPENTNVYGKVGGTSPPRVYVTHVDSGGAWNLSEGNRVEGVAILNGADTGAVFALNHRCTINSCDYEAEAGLAMSDYMCDVVAGYEEIRFTNNKVATTTGVFNNFSMACTDTFISGNVIKQSYILGSTVLVSCGGSGLVFKNNTISSYNDIASTTQAYGLSVSTSTGSRFAVSDNLITIGGRDGWRDSTGIYIDLSAVASGSSTEVSIHDNIIRADSSSTSIVDNGIVVAGHCENAKLEGNQIHNCSRGIVFEDYYKNVSISNNIIHGATNRGILVNVGSITNNILYDLSIDNNIIENMYSSGPATVLWDNNLYGIHVVVSDTTGNDTQIKQLCITNNKINKMENSPTSQNTIGIHVDLDLGTSAGAFNDQIVIDNNNISGLLSDGMGGVSGIYLTQFNDPNCNMYNTSVCSNKIKFLSDSGPSVCGVFVEGYSIINGRFDGNSIHIESIDGNVSDPGSGLLLNPLLQDELVNCSICNNVINVPWTGIFCVSTGTPVRNNKIHAGSVGIAYFPDADDEYNNSVFGNTIEIQSNNENPWGSGAGGSFGGDGTYCIVTHDDVSNFEIAKNSCKLRGNAAAELLDESACIFVKAPNYFSLDGNETRIEGVTGIAGGGNAYHIYYDLAAAAGGIDSFFSISNNKVYNQDTGLVISVVSGLYVDQTAYAWGTDYAKGHFSANTFFTSITDSQGANGTWEGDGNAGVPRPYEFYMFAVENPIASTTGCVTFTGNSFIHRDDNQPKVFMADESGTNGGTSPGPWGVDTNDTNWVSSTAGVQPGGGASNQWW